MDCFGTCLTHVQTCEKAVGGSVGPVGDDEASAEESESLSPPVVDGPYFDSPHAKRQKLDHLLKHSVPAST